MAAIPARWRNWTSCRQAKDGVVGPSEDIGGWPSLSSGFRSHYPDNGCLSPCSPERSETGLPTALCMIYIDKHIVMWCHQAFHFRDSVSDPSQVGSASTSGGL